MNRRADRPTIEYALRHAARNKVILMHDIYPTTAAAVPAIMTGLQSRGYTLVTVSELCPKLRPGGRYPGYQGQGFAHRNDYPPDHSLPRADRLNSGNSPCIRHLAGAEGRIVPKA